MAGTVNIAEHDPEFGNEWHSSWYKSSRSVVGRHGGSPRWAKRGDWHQGGLLWELGIGWGRRSGGGSSDGVGSDEACRRRRPRRTNTHHTHTHACAYLEVELPMRPAP